MDREFYRKERDEWMERALSAEKAMEGLKLALRVRGHEFDQAREARDGWRKRYDEAVSAAAGYQKQANELSGQHALSVAKLVEKEAEIESLQMKVMEKDREISRLESCRGKTIVLGNPCVEGEVARYKRDIEALRRELKDSEEEFDMLAGQLRNRVLGLEKIVEQTEADLIRAEKEASWARKDLVRVAQARNNHWGSLLKEQEAHRKTRAEATEMAKDIKAVSGMWSQTMDSRALLWNAIDGFLTGTRKKKHLRKALEKAYIKEWGGKVVILSAIAEEMHKAICGHCNSKDKRIGPAKKKGRLWYHVWAPNQTHRYCHASPLRRFLEERYLGSDLPADL